MRWMQKNIKLWLVLAGFLFAATAQAVQPTLSMVTPALPPLGPGDGSPGFLELIAREAFARIDYSIHVTVLPAERALINVNQGIDDGDLYRAPGFETHFSNLVRVPEPISKMEFMAYTKNLNIPHITWKSLRPYNIAYATGWKIYDRMAKARGIIRVRSLNELFPLLEKNRADIVLLDRWQGSYLARKQGVQFKLLEPPLATVNMYMYLNKRYKNLVPKLAAALKSMKKDGTYNHIFKTTLKHY